MNRRLAFVGLALLLTTPLDVTAQGAKARKPNIVYILADDLGWGDVGWHGSDIKTPHLDKLATAGTRLEQFYVLPVCSPTRAALLTGRYPIRHGLQVGVVRPWAQYGLPLEERTLAQALRQAGYFTAIIGKWHLGHFRPEYLPTRRGFDHQYGHYNGALDYFTHERDGGHDWHRNDKESRDEGYATTLLGQEAVKLIRERDKAKPFFLYVAFNAVHSPHQVPAKYLEGYGSMKEPRRTYAGMLTAMDEAIGRIAAALEAENLLEDTIICFSSDNGGPAPGRVTSNGPLRAGKGTLYEGGVRVPAFIAWKGTVPAGVVVDEPMHIVDWYPTFLRLAGASLEQKLPLDGIDFWPAITQGKRGLHDAILINTTPRSGAIRVGDWKLVLNGNAPDQAIDGGKGAAKEPLVELFDLKRDPYEKTNLAREHPDRVRELQARYDAYRNQAVPPRYQVKPPPGFKTPRVWGE